MVECLGQFRRQKGRVAEPDVWCRGDIGKVGSAIVRPLFIVGSSGSRNRIVVSGWDKNRRTGTRAFRALDLRTKTIWYVFILFLRRKLARARPCHSEGQGKVGWDCTDNYLGSRPAALINILILKGSRAVAYHFV